MQKIVGYIIFLIAIQISFIKGANFTERLKDDRTNFDENITETVYAATVIRKSRQTDSSDPLNQDTDRLKNQISNFSDSFRKELSLNPSNSTSKMTNLENEIKKVKEEIERLKKAPNVDSSSKTKFSSLESAIETSQKLFDESKKISASQLKNLESIIDALTASVSEYRRELEKIKVLMDEKDKMEKERRMPAEIAQDIRDGQTYLANKKYLKLEGDYRRNADHVIRAVDINHGDGFARLVEFSRSLHQESNVVLKFYEALRQEMEAVRFADVNEILKLIAAVKFTLVDNTWDDVPDDAKRASKIFLENLVSTFKDLATQKFEDAMIADKYKSVLNVSEEMSEDDHPSMFRDIIKRVVSNTIDKIDAEKLIDFVKQHRLVFQWCYGFSAIFNELKTKNRLNSPAVVFLAYDLKNLMGMRNYENTSPEARTAAEDLKKALPRSVRILAFYKYVCIKNVGRQERLFADDYQSFDESRRRVNTWVPGTRVSRDQWMVFPYENKFYIKSYKIKEYLYAADDNHKVDQTRRRVLTWIPGDMVLQGSWMIEPNGDDVYIRNYIHNEYLYADWITHGNDRPIFTYGSGSKPSNSLWTIEDCS